MASKNIRMRPEGIGDYADVLHPETNTSMVITSDGVSLEEKLDEINVELSVKLNRTESALSSDKLTTPRTIDGIAFDGSTNITSYAVCSSDGADGVKAITLVGAQAVAGLPVRVKFVNENAHSEPSLSINETITGTIRTSNNSAFKDIKAGGVYTFVFDGSAFILQGESGVNGSGGGSGELNIFIQPDEPETKEGVWVQGEGIYDEVIEDYDLYFKNGLVPNPEDYYPLTYTRVLESALINYKVVIHEDKLFHIYYANLYHYDLNTKVNTTIASQSGMPSFVYDNFLFYVSSRSIYKRNLTTNENTEFKAFPKGNNIQHILQLSNGRMLVIVQFDDGEGWTGDYLYIYDLNTGAQLKQYQLNSTFPLSNGYSFYVYNDNLYSTSPYDAKKLTRVFNLETGTITTLPITQESTKRATLSSSAPLIVGNKVYINCHYQPATNQQSRSQFLILDLDNYTYEETDIADNTGAYSYVYNGSALAFYKSQILLFGDKTRNGVTYTNQMFHIYSFYDKPLPENTLVLNKSGTLLKEVEFSTISKLPFRYTTMFGDLYYYKNNSQQYYPMYYGNGTSWVKFKN